MGDSAFTGVVRERQKANEEQAFQMLDAAEEIIKSRGAGTADDGDLVEKVAPWVKVGQEKGWGKSGPGGTRVVKYQGTFWMLKGRSIIGWIERRGKKWLARPINRDEWKGDSFKKAVAHIASPHVKGQPPPPPGVKGGGE